MVRSYVQLEFQGLRQNWYDEPDVKYLPQYSTKNSSCKGKGMPGREKIILYVSDS